MFDNDPITTRLGWVAWLLSAVLFAYVTADALGLFGVRTGAVDGVSTLDQPVKPPLKSN